MTASGPSRPTEDPAESQLAFEELHTDASKSLILLHGLFGSSKEFSPLSAQYLTDYHLLIPECHSLPPHSFTLPFICSRIASLIYTHAHNRKASVAGCSMGGNIALYLAAHYPEVIEQVNGGVLASGVSSFSKWNPMWGMIVPAWLVIESHLVGLIAPKDLFGEGQAVVEESIRATRKLRTYANCKQIHGALANNTFEPVRARTLIVCSKLSDWRKGHFCDSAEDALEIRDRIKSNQGNNQSQAIAVPSCSHPWNLQNPRLFAEVLKAWLQNRNLPEEVQIM